MLRCQFTARRYLLNTAGFVGRLQTLTGLIDTLLGPTSNSRPPPVVFPIRPDISFALNPPPPLPLPPLTPPPSSRWEQTLLFSLIILATISMQIT